MKKLLLLTAIPVTAFLYSFAGKAQSGNSDFTIPFKDSNILEETLLNPRDGFKDLFDNNATADFSVKLNPQAISFVQDYMTTEGKNLNAMKSWGRPYFDLMDNILSKHGIPTELKYLSVIESQLKSSARSWVGAVGPWQFMPETAKLMGLRVSGKYDERKDFTKSTHAAARYLNYLYNIYNDWLLVVAAYNGGPGKVNSAIRKSGSRNFWKLQYHLPKESRNHVKKFIATHYIMEGDGSDATLTKSERDQQMLQQPPNPSFPNSEVITVSGKYNSLIIAQLLNMDISEFNRLNPGFDKQLSAVGSYALRLPSDKVLMFKANKPQILEQSIRLALASAAR